jgi:hypothetical protein
MTTPVSKQVHRSADRKLTEDELAHVAGGAPSNNCHGGVKSAACKRETDVLAWSWGLSNSGSHDLTLDRGLPASPIALPDAVAGVAPLC